MYSAYKSAATVASAVKDAPEGYSWGQRLRAIPRMLKAAFTGRWEEANRFGLTLSVLGLAYVLSPLDIIPELFLSVFGLADDLAIAAASVAYLVVSTDKYLTGTFPNLTAPGAPTGEVIQGIVIPSGGEEDTTQR